MVIAVWIVVSVASAWMIVWAALTVRELKRAGLENAKPYGLDSVKSSIRWFAIFPILVLMTAGMLSTAPSLTSPDAQKASVVTALTGVKIPSSNCCDGSQQEVLADWQERVVAGVQSLGTLLLGVGVAIACMRMGRNAVALVR